MASSFYLILIYSQGILSIFFFQFYVCSYLREKERAHASRGRGAEGERENHQADCLLSVVSDDVGLSLTTPKIQDLS